MKKGARILGIDDAAFEFDDSYTFLNGVVYRGTEFIENIQSLKVEIDGEDATERVIELFEGCKNTTQIKAVMTDGVSFGGFNVIDLEEIAKRTGKPVIAVTSNKPDKERFIDTLEKYSNGREKIERLDEPKTVEVESGEIYIQFSGTDFKEAREIAKSSIIYGKVPEPIRVAHMIGRAQRNLV